MGKLKHLLFDCDGVLVDTEFIAAERMTAALNGAGTDLNVNYYLKNFSGTTFSSIVEHYFESDLSTEERLSLISKVEQEVASKVKTIKGVKVLLAGNSMSKSVVSNSSIATVVNSLDKTGIRKYFTSQIFSSELVSNPKPAPDIYQLALTSIKLKPSEVLVIEDSISGASAAISAGLKVIGFLGGSHIMPGHGDKLLALGVIDVAHNMKELDAIIRRLSKS